jgi:hypothetical protein
MELFGMFFVSVEFIPTILFEPISTPFKIVTLSASHTLFLRIISFELFKIFMLI